MKLFNRLGLSLITIAIIALLLRVWGLAYDLPYVYHPDEPLYISISQHMFKALSLNPRFFNYPSLMFYIHALAYVPYYLVGCIAGAFRSPSDIATPTSLVMGVTKTTMPSTVLLGRTITVAFGVLSVVVVYVLGRQVSGQEAVGILAALMMATCPTAVAHSRMVTPDTLVTLLALCSVLASVMVWRNGRVQDYALAGCCAGLTASTKYNGALVLVSLLAAHGFRSGKASLRDPKLYLAFICCLMSFVLGTPYALLDTSNFLAGLRFEAKHYTTGHAGMEGDSLRWYIGYLWRTGGLLYVLSVIGMVHGILLRPKELVIFVAFPLAYCILISSLAVRNDRTLLPAIPFLLILSAWSLIGAARTLAMARRQFWHYLILLPLIGAGLAGMALATQNTIVATQKLTQPDSRTTARVWVDNNLPAGAKVAIESYSPFIDDSKYRVSSFVRMIDHDPEWYIAEGFDYLIFAEGMYGRFFREPEQYACEKSRYEHLWESFQLVRIFTDGDYEVRIYKVK